MSTAYLVDPEGVLRYADVDVGLDFATDGRIPAFNFSVLKDTKNYFPAYAITPTVRKETLDANPDLAEHLNKLSGLFDDATISALNAEVDVDRKSVTSGKRSGLSVVAMAILLFA